MGPARKRTSGLISPVMFDTLRYKHAEPTKQMSHLPFVPPSLAAPLTRRGFLKRGAVGSALLLAARFGFCAPRASAQATRAGGSYPPNNLDAARFATLEAFCDRIITPAPGAPTAREARVALRIDHEIRYQGPSFARDLQDALILIEYGGLFEGKFRRFTRLSSEDQDEVIRAMLQSRLAIRRTCALGLKVIVAFFYYADDRTWKSTGYDGPWMPRRVADTERAFPFPTLDKEKKP
jgi:hypothetical protein